MTMNILNRLKSIGDLPTMPDVLLGVQKLVHSGDSSASGLAEVISHDPALAAKILKVANSAYFGGGTQRISSVILAVTRIGFIEVGHIVMAVSLIRQFGRQGFCLDVMGFWRHSLTAAFLAEKVRSVCTVELPRQEYEQLYLAGLLHDIGILVYDQFFNQEFRTILDYAGTSEMSFLCAEAHVAVGEAHPQVGGALLEMWRLDPLIVNGVRYHHAPERAPGHARAFVCMAAIIEHVLCNLSMGSFEGLTEALDPQIVQWTGISEEGLTHLFEAAETASGKAGEVLADSAHPGQGTLRLV